MENENKESKSNGMELLENVIKSNIENIEQNIKLQSDIEDHTNLLNEIQMSLQEMHSIYDDAVRFSKLEEAKRTEFLDSIPSQVETVLSKETKDDLEGFEKDIKWKKIFIWSGVGIFVFSVVVLIASINFATNWYKESIKAKSELRQDILNEIAVEGKKIYDEKEIRLLRENTQVVQFWIKNNPKKAEDFLRFKDGYEASMKSK
ncbi:hypothetical protein EG346_12250 [Chryseobacterium carnipullorum]|uniref:Uncharacterized protein n=2 Tax=Chryseobacterium TaxID=59732 RepID=A0A376DRZ1_CHRCU|nr:hypothetical protein [Chryseobacterium carnipullorum]AZA48898.1 hypothetical protein EG346_12250 [Chryseobacterium carnipullorum]AZA63799.1 hypothetical protein EG345_03160 [Chryseobacterium carnipullorum]STC93473.1 Uncharacterised protein [Chryseobacterium carnipullorum]